jgi:rhomboid-like protein
MVSQLAAARSPSAVAVASAKQMTPAKTTVSEILPSLGASGAIYSALVLTALGFPDLHIALAIPPSFPIPVQYGVGGLVLVDCIGILRGWRYVYLLPRWTPCIDSRHLDVLITLPIWAAQCLGRPIT